MIKKCEDPNKPAGLDLHSFLKVDRELILKKVMHIASVLIMSYTVIFTFC